MEDTYPKLMRNFLDFRNEMTVILVIWQECQQRIERHSEEQVRVLHMLRPDTPSNLSCHCYFCLSK